MIFLAFSLPSASSLLKLLFGSHELFFDIKDLFQFAVHRRFIFRGILRMRAVGKNPNATPIREQSGTSVTDFVLISILGIIRADHLKIS